MVEKGIRGRICHVIIHRYAKANNKYMKNYDKNKKTSVFECKLFVWIGNVLKIACKWF